ncbi:hypothetical protein MtrunA17_Chr1g0191331 [Medicago truncatula]|uniref:Uncharacterized protein n=1 Tax=Medicago truncatula TaxID=3880 RepID=A0A396JT59_MEDTR|nr:hypothetical protein MtrunA17_Chr1g0191331 [Medicago truncatula]
MNHTKPIFYPIACKIPKICLLSVVTTIHHAIQTWVEIFTYFKCG